MSPELLQDYDSGLEYARAEAILDVVQVWERLCQS